MSSANKTSGAPVTIIVGAGISVPAPTLAPDFRKLRDRFLHLADPQLEPDRFQLDELSPEQTFDAVDDGRDELRRAVRQELWWLCEPNEPNANHYGIAALLGAGARVWTPNFDAMIERAATRMGIPVGALVPGDPIAMPGPQHALMKPHGSFPLTGDPPREPSVHDYRLLFQASAVWLLDDDWSDRLRSDLRGSHVHLFGYRGADPDLTPIMLAAFDDALSVTWWEFASAQNFVRLERLLQHSRAQVAPGDPSAALQDLAQQRAPHIAPAPHGSALQRPSTVAPITLSHLSRAQLLGQLRGSAVARHHLARAAILDPPANRRLARFRLLRSIGYDKAWVRVPLLAALSAALRLRGSPARPRAVELYATLADARPIGPGDRRVIRRLLQVSTPERAGVLIRVASIEKLHGELAAAAAHVSHVLRDVERERRPRLEAMAVYNLAWIYRKQAAFAARADLVTRYQDRMPHIGFNWAAWLALDDVLLALHVGDVAGARTRLSSPFMAYARSLIAHPMYRIDDAVTNALVEWHEHGPHSVGQQLGAILRSHPVRPFVRAPFSAIDALIALGDHVGDLGAMRRHLRLAERRTASDLQRAQIELVKQTADGQRVGLERFRDQATRRGFGLIAESAEAILAHHDGRSTAGVKYQPSLPLPGIY